MPIQSRPYLTLLLLLGLCSNANHAQATDWIYAEAGMTRSTVDVTGTKFNPQMSRYKLGIAIWDGILIEAQRVNQGDDTAYNSTVTIDEISATYLRLDGPIRSSMRMYALLGEAETRLTVSGTGGVASGSDNYKDFSWGIGLEDRTFSKYTLLTLEYTSYYNHDEVAISGVSLGFKLEF